jgi:hypothetical protein
MSEITKSLLHTDSFKIEVKAERDGVLRLLGNFAHGTGLNLRPRMRSALDEGTATTARAKTSSRFT